MTISVASLVGPTQASAANTVNVGAVVAAAAGARVVVLAMFEAASAPSVSGVVWIGGPTFSRRTRLSAPGSTTTQVVEAWYADLTASNSGALAVNFTANFDDAVVFVFAASGTTISWDANASLPASLALTSAAATLSTAQPNSSAPLYIQAIGSSNNTGYGAIIPAAWMTQQQSMDNGGGTNWQHAAWGSGAPGVNPYGSGVAMGWGVSSVPPSPALPGLLYVDVLYEAGAAGSATGTGAISFAGVGTATVVAVSSATGTGAITFAASGVASQHGTVTATGTGAIAFAGTGRVTGPVSSDIPTFAPPEWAWYLLDPATGGYISALTTATARQLNFPIDAGATAQFTMPGSVDLSGPAPETALIVELATDVYVTRNGRPVFRGRIGTSADTHANDSDTLQFTAVDYRGLLDHRVIWPGSQLVFDGTHSPNEQTAIAWKLISDTQATEGGDLGITEGHPAGYPGIGSTGVTSGSAPTPPASRSARPWTN